MFDKCYQNTLHATTEILDDGTTFIITGDIPAMWLRDSAAQVNHYLPVCRGDALLQQIIEGLIKRQIMYILIDPYANAFNKNPDNSGHKSDITEHNPWVWERKYEIDSLCYPVKLAYEYWKTSGSTSIFDNDFIKAMYKILELWKTEQHHEKSPYRFHRTNCPQSDTLRHMTGTPVNYTGMSWSGFRPSDDACDFGYLVPSNMFAVVVLGYMEEIADSVFKDSTLMKAASALKEEIDFGIRTYGIYDHPVFGRIYAYETDGFGNYNLMDDANVPSLLSIPYIGYRGKDDPIYRNTRNFILSSHNKYYYRGKCASGVGSPHTPDGFIWHIGLIMQALTSSDEKEIVDIIDILGSTDAGTEFMHESFNADNHDEFTRSWFAWANSLYGELIYKQFSKTSVIDAEMLDNACFLR